MPTSAEASSEVLVDTSVAVAVVVVDHGAHHETIEALQGRMLGLAGPAWFESYSLLTRLPGANRRRPVEAMRLLTHDFPRSKFLDARTQQRLTQQLVDLEIAGGAVYDALVGAVAKHHGVPLLTRDRRALDTYRKLDVDVELLG